MPVFPHAAPSWVLAYRELVARTRAQRLSAAAADDPAAARAALATARGRARAYVRARRAALGASAPDPRAALTRVVARAAAARERLAAARDERVERLRVLAASAAAGAAGVAADAADAVGGRLRVVAAGRGGEAAAEAEMLGSDGVLRHLVMRSIATASRAFMHGAVTTRVEGAPALAAALARPDGTPLITVCNHETALDDPLIVAALLPAAAVGAPAGLRWTLCATDRCFTSAAATAFFRAGKVLPVARGAGLAQPGMAAAEGRLAAGEWVHVFPEGTRSKDGALRPARKGVGRLAVAAAAASGVDPVILPFAHSGMRGVIPPGAVVPRPGGTVGVVVGDPIRLSTVAAAHAAAGSPGGEDGLYVAVADAVGRALAGLKARADAVAGVAPATVAAAATAPHATPANAVIPSPADLAAEAEALAQDEAAALAPRWACASGAVRAAVAAARAPSSAAGVAAAAPPPPHSPASVAAVLRGSAAAAGGVGGAAADAVRAWGRARASAAAAALLSGGGAGPQWAHA